MNFLKRLSVTEDNIIKVVQFHKDLIPDDVLERLSGKEEFIDTDETLNEKIYSISNIKETILDDVEDDTNETTKCRIEGLYKLIEEYEYLMITKV